MISVLIALLAFCSKADNVAFGPNSLVDFPTSGSAIALQPQPFKLYTRNSDDSAYVTVGGATVSGSLIEHQEDMSQVVVGTVTIIDNHDGTYSGTILANRPGKFEVIILVYGLPVRDATLFMKFGCPSTQLCKDCVQFVSCAFCESEIIDPRTGETHPAGLCIEKVLPKLGLKCPIEPIVELAFCPATNPPKDRLKDSFQLAVSLHRDKFLAVVTQIVEKANGKKIESADVFDVLFTVFGNLLTDSQEQLICEKFKQVVKTYDLGDTTKVKCVITHAKKRGLNPSYIAKLTRGEEAGSLVVVPAVTFALGLLAAFNSL